LITSLLAGAGFSFSSGLNAYLPLLILALADRIGSSLELESPYHWISTNEGLLALLILVPVELLADKIPRIDHLNDLVHTAIRPVAGAFCFMAVASDEGSPHVWLAGSMGLAIAGSVHVWKMRARVKITRATSGLGNPFVSVLEDGIAIIVAILAAAAPVVNVAAIPLGLAIIQRSFRRMAKGESRLIHAFQPRSRT